MLKILRKNRIYLIAVLTVIVTVLIVLGIHDTKEPEQCALCGGLKCHAPCIVNLSTGEVGELTIFEPHPTLVGEIAEEQPGGTLEFFSCAGYRAVRDTDARTCVVELPESDRNVNTRYFCPVCQDMLTGMKGYALMDLYALDDIKAYPVEDRTEWRIRDYSVSVKWDMEKEKFEVRNSSLIP